MTHEVQKTGNSQAGGERVIVPLADIDESANEYVITMDMAGVEKTGVDITLDDNELTIRGAVDEPLKEKDITGYAEFSLYNYRRSFTVGNDIDSEKIRAAINNGVLSITLPKKEEIKPKKIEISVN